MNHPANVSTDISIPEFQAVLESPPESHCLLDVRTEKEFAHGHLPGSVNIPIAVLEPRLGELPKDLPIIVVCHAGVRSAHALEILASRGFQNIRHLPGGLMRLTG